MEHQMPSMDSSMPMSASSQRGMMGRFAFVKKLFSHKMLLVAVVVIQLVLVYFAFNPPYLYQYSLNRQVLDELARKTTINPYENPVITVVKSADGLRAENSIQAQVYKDVKDGDYIIGFSDKIIVYRRTSGEIVYEGDSPRTVLEKTAQELATKIIAKAEAGGLLQKPAEGETQEQPGLSVVTDVAALQTQDATFYAQTANGDIIATFPTAQLIVLYRADTDSILNSGRFTTSISAM